MRRIVTLFFGVLFSFSLVTAQSENVQIAPDALETLTLEKPSHRSQKATKPFEELYQEVKLFKKVSETKSPNSALRAWVRMEVDEKAVQQLYKDRKEYLSLEIPALDNEDMVVELARQELFTEDFKVVTSESRGRPIEVDLGHHYSGVVKGDPQSTVSFSIFKNEIIGMISRNGHNLVVKPEDDREGYMLYDDKDVALDMPFSCEALSHPEMSASPPLSGNMEVSNCVKVYLECDHALYNNKGGITATTNWITSVYNNVKTLYSNESISTVISEIFIWTSPDGYSRTSSYTALTQFRNNNPSYNGDLAHLCALGGHNIGGIAWLDVLCSSYGYAYSNIHSTYNNVPTYSWTVEVMTHEMGHNLGSNHTHWCGWTGGAIDDCYTPEGGCSRGPSPTNGGTVMSYCHLTHHGINFNNGFATQPGDKIRNEVAGAGCLSASCGGSCSTPTGLSVSGITQTSATVSWNSVSGANTYDLEYKVNTGTSWTRVSTSSTSYNLTGLSPGTTYDVRVRAVCSGSTSNWSGIVTFTTDAGSCNIPSGLSISNISSSSADASWNSVSGANSYDLQHRVSPNGSWVTNNTTSTSYSLSGLSSSTTYDVRVRSVCSGSTSNWSSIVSFTTDAPSSYCSSSGSSCSREWIRRVRQGSIDRSSGCDNGYYDGTHLSTDITKGAYNLIYIAAGRTGGSRRFYWRVWIDLNHNGSFNDAGELRVSGYSSSTGLLYAWMYVPSSATNGETRMRVSMRYGGYPGSCGTFSRGEVEDYTVNIIGTGTLKEDNGQEDLTLKGIKDATLAPNPTHQNSVLEFYSAIGGQLNLSLLDITGQPVRQWSEAIVEGHNFLEVETSQLTQGSYLLRVDDGVESKVLKLLKL
ncbi:MAG: fibronectin type III domain-containing protein [Saprospiraceae bacterium]|nr:fibronectin type III domain-containing protein [Saprospiraceae bacterium]